MEHEVILYSSTGCGYCAKLKKFFEKENVSYEERNVTVNPAYLEELKDKGIWSVPTVFVDGQAVPGYRPNRLKELLQI